MGQAVLIETLEVRDVAIVNASDEASHAKVYGGEFVYCRADPGEVESLYPAAGADLQ